MYPRVHAQTAPDKPAVIMAASGATVSYAQLDERSIRLSRLLYDRGLRPGDAIAYLIENNESYFEVVWAAQRSGLYYTPVSVRLTPGEVEYIVRDSGAKAVIVSEHRRDAAVALSDALADIPVRLFIGDPPEGWESYRQAVAAVPAEPLDVELEGVDMIYSSGTTGRPKGVRRPLPLLPAGTPDNGVMLMRDLFGCDGSTVFLSTAPLYHGAPLILSTAIQRLGGTVVVMERFDAEEALAAIERYGVTASQWVPTMFVRLLKLEPAARSRYDLLSHTLAIHGAGPCPVDVKRQMIDWWGPILFDYYSGTEGAGVCAITSQEWLTHVGSVGRAILGEVHVVDDDGQECAAGEVGLVYFAAGPKFEYHNDPEKSAGARNEQGWTTLGDIGYLDDEGYLYLTDRKAFTIVSGGVNIYPQEIEDVLVLHPSVIDVAVFGIPSPDLVEETKAVVQPTDMALAGPDLARELMDYCRQRLASYKCPKSIDFCEELPRAATGKLYKQELRRRYLAKNPGR